MLRVFLHSVVILVACCFAAPYTYAQLSATDLQCPIPNFICGYYVGSPSTYIDNMLIRLPQHTNCDLPDSSVNENGTGYFRHLTSQNAISIPGIDQIIIVPVSYPAGENARSDIKDVLYNYETGLLISKFAEMISLDPEDLSNLPLYRFLDDWYGVKYKFGGEDNNGIDCSAFSQKLYGSIFSVSILRTSRQQYKNSEVFRKYDEAEEGDLVFFRIHRLRISHVGVYLANGYFVHASRSRGVVISNLNDKYWSRRYAGCGRIEREVRQSAESDFLQ